MREKLSNKGPYILTKMNGYAASEGADGCG